MPSNRPLSKRSSSHSWEVDEQSPAYWRYRRRVSSRSESRRRSASCMRRHTPESIVDDRRIQRRHPAAEAIHNTSSLVRHVQNN